MKNPADLKELCEEIVKAAREGNSVYEPIDNSSYKASEVIYELALDYLVKRETNNA